MSTSNLVELTNQASELERALWRLLLLADSSGDQSLIDRIERIHQRARARWGRRIDAECKYTKQIASAVEREAFQKLENDPACDSGKCNSCSVFYSCMGSFCEIHKPNSGDTCAAPLASASDSLSLVNGQTGPQETGQGGNQTIQGGYEYSKHQCMYSGLRLICGRHA